MYSFPSDTCYLNKLYQTRGAQLHIQISQGLLN